jgi:hypothetical protein
MDDGIFPHKCTEDGCHLLVQFDDEPKCFQHSPDSGSSVRGWSARAVANRKARDLGFADFGTAKAQLEFLTKELSSVGVL